MDFAYSLRWSNATHPQRGSADAILDALTVVGPLQFEEAELETLLEEIEAMRQLDISDEGRMNNSSRNNFSQNARSSLPDTC
jgi:hypothetical protein